MDKAILINRQFSGILCLKRITVSIVLSTKHKRFVDPKKGKSTAIYIFNSTASEFFHVTSCIGRDKKSWQFIFQTVLNNIAAIWRFLLSSQRTQVLLIRGTQGSLFTALFLFCKSYYPLTLCLCVSSEWAFMLSIANTSHAEGLVLLFLSFVM